MTSPFDDRGTDPGWRGAWRGAAVFLPGGAQLVARRRASEGTSTLVLLRALWVGFVGMIVAIGAVVAVLATAGGLQPSGISTAIALAMVLGVGGGSLAAQVLTTRPLDPATLPDEATLAGAYRTRFFLGLAFADLPALVGFVAFVLTAEPLLYVPGALLTLAGQARIAPTRRRIERTQDALTTSGSPLSLLHALTAPAAPDDAPES